MTALALFVVGVLIFWQATLIAERAAARRRVR